MSHYDKDDPDHLEQPTSEGSKSHGSPTSPVFNSNSMKCSMKLHLYATIFDASNENQASSNCFFSPSFLKNSKFFNKHAKNRLIQSSIILILT